MYSNSGLFVSSSHPLCFKHRNYFYKNNFYKFIRCLNVIINLSLPEGYLIDRVFQIFGVQMNEVHCTYSETIR